MATAPMMSTSQALLSSRLLSRLISAQGTMPKYVVNPTFAEREESDIDVVVVGVGDQVVMIEGGMKEVSEDNISQILAKWKEL
jgi:polyribonucleotide nucleotidyltransferase